MTKEQALFKLQTMCSKTEYCEFQIRKKLRDWSVANLKKGIKEFDNNEIEEIIKLLISKNYINDRRFTNAYVRDKARFQKWGERKIIYNLKNFEIKGDIINQAINDNLDLFNDEILVSLLRKKMMQINTNLENSVKREKLIRFGISKGFSYEKVLNAVILLFKDC